MYENFLPMGNAFAFTFAWYEWTFKPYILCTYCLIQQHCKDLFTPNDFVTVTGMLTSGTFDLFNGHYDRQNGLHTNFPHQCNVCYVDGEVVAQCEQTLTDWRYVTWTKRMHRTEMAPRFNYFRVGRFNTYRIELAHALNWDQLVKALTRIDQKYTDTRKKNIVKINFCWYLTKRGNNKAKIFIWHWLHTILQTS